MDVSSQQVGEPDAALNPTVSVLIPAYNAAETLERAVKSVRAQTHPVHEIIVADDGSTDGTAELASSLGCTALALPKANGAVARNKAFEASTGDFVFLLDSDDEWLPRKVEAHLEAYQDPNVPFIVDPSRRVRPDGSERGLNSEGPRAFLSWEQWVDGRYWSCGSAISARREAWEKIGGFNPSLNALQDIDFLIRAAHANGPGLHLEECLTRYHLSEGGVSRSKEWREAVLDGILKSCPFLLPEHAQSLRRVVALRNALIAPPSHFLAEMRWGKVPLNDRVVLTAFLLSLERALRQAFKKK